MAGPSLFRPSNITTGLVGYWKLDEASGSRADSSGNGNTLTDNNTVASVAQDYWKTGENSADFERSNSEYLSISDGSQTGLDLTGSWSFACFVKPESSAVLQAIASKKNLDGDADGYNFGIYTDDKLYVRNSGTLVQATGATIPVGKWTHVAVVYNGSVVAFYVNGNLDTVVSSSTNPAGNAIQFALGCRGSITQDFFDGLMKDAGLWNVALTPIQIKSLALGVDLASYAYRPSNVSTAPTHWWKLNELNGTRNDSIGSLHLTDNNTVTALGGYVEGVGADFESGNSEYLSGADSADFDFGTGDFAVHWQMKFESINAENRMWSLGGQWSAGKGISLGYDGSTITLYNNGNAGTTDTFSWTAVVGTFYHCCIRRASGTVYFYVDGIEISNSANSDNIDGSTGGMSIGVWNGTLSFYFDGVMSDFAFWKGYALTVAEIKSLACGIPLQQTGIVSYWKLDEPSGNRADIIGVNNLTDNNTVLSGTGKVSNAADFEASYSEYLSIADASQSGLDVTDLTMLCWYKPESTGITSALFDKDGYGSGYGMLIQSTNKLNMTIANNFVDTVNTSLSAGTFYHCVGVYDGADKRVYLNSAKDGNEATTTVIADTAAVFYLGRDASGDYADGLMDEALLAKRWFRDEEIKTIYCKGLCGKELTSEEIVSSSSSGNFFLFF